MFLARTGDYLRWVVLTTEDTRNSRAVHLLFIALVVRCCLFDES